MALRYRLEAQMIEFQLKRLISLDWYQSTYQSILPSDLERSSRLTSANRSEALISETSGHNCPQCVNLHLIAAILSY